MPPCRAHMVPAALLAPSAKVHFSVDAQNPQSCKMADSTNCIEIKLGHKKWRLAGVAVPAPASVSSFRGRGTVICRMNPWRGSADVACQRGFVRFGLRRNPMFGIMTGRQGHFSAGHFIGCSVSHLHVLVGNQTVVQQKHRKSPNCSTQNLKTYFLWIEHGLSIQMSPKKPHIWYNGWDGPRGPQTTTWCMRLNCS